MSLHGPRRGAAPSPAASAPREAPQSVTAAVQPLLEHYQKDGVASESQRIAQAWELYETPEVRFATRQYANAFASSQLVLARRKVLWQDPEPILEPSSKEEQKAFELLQSFAGGPVGQGEMLDRMGVYFVVTGDMALVGAYDPALAETNRFAKWDVWSTSEVKWDGQKIRIRTNQVEDIWQDMPDYIRHLRVWNRHPRRGWESDSPVLSSLKVLELIGLYDDRLTAEALSRLIGAGVWMIPQGMQLPNSQGGTGGPADFLKLLRDVASIAIKDRRSPAANVPIMVEAAADDIDAASKGLMNFHTDFADKLADHQERAIRRWATGVDLPPESMLGLSQATHWNAALISEEKVQSFIVPSLRRAVHNITTGWLRPALAQFAMNDPSLEVWFDASRIRTRVDTADEAQWAKDRFMINEADTKYAIGLGAMQQPNDEDLKRQMLLHMAFAQPEFVPAVLTELGIPNNMPELTNWQATRTSLNQAPQRFSTPGSLDKTPPTNTTGGKQGPQQNQETSPPPPGPGRGATLSTTERDFTRP